MHAVRCLHAACTCTIAVTMAREVKRNFDKIDTADL